MYRTVLNCLNSQMCAAWARNKIQQAAWQGNLLPFDGRIFCLKGVGAGSWLSKIQCSNARKIGQPTNSMARSRPPKTKASA